MKHKEKTLSCISKHVKTLISGTPEPLASSSTKSAFKKENFIKSLLCCFDSSPHVFLKITAESGDREVGGERKHKETETPRRDF